jgi:tight adherence protein B
MQVAVIVFAIVVAIVLGAYWAFVVRPEDAESDAVRRRLRGRAVSTTVSAPVVKVEERLSALVPLEAVLSRSRGLVDPLGRLIAHSGVSVRIGTVVLTCVFAAVAGFAICMWLFLSMIVAIAVGAVFATFPILYLRRAGKKRMAVFEEQFPEAIDLMARSLRAGHALTTALQMVGDEIPDPIGGEFRQLFEMQNYGMSLPEALREFAERIPVLDARFFVTAVLIQRESGGNLSEVLDNLSAVIKERFTVKRQVRVMSAHGRITGLVLGFLPPVLAVVLYIISPEHIMLLIDDPLGLQMITAGMVLQVIGVFIIRRIVDVEY